MLRLIDEKNPQIYIAFRHIDIHNGWIYQEGQRGIVQGQYLKTDLISADSLTKILPRIKFFVFVKLLGLVDCPTGHSNGSSDDDNSNDSTGLPLHPYAPPRAGKSESSAPIGRSFR